MNHLNPPVKNRRTVSRRNIRELELTLPSDCIRQLQRELKVIHLKHENTISAIVLGDNGKLINFMRFQICVIGSEVFLSPNFNPDLK